MSPSAAQEKVCCCNDAGMKIKREHGIYHTAPWRGAKKLNVLSGLFSRLAGSPGPPKLNDVIYTTGLKTKDDTATKKNEEESHFFDDTRLVGIG